MKQVCDYCNNYIEDTDQMCPHCGATNKNYKRQSGGTPKTIQELKDWYEAHNLPPENVTRFFIGKDCKEKRAFGIYQDGERFVVYKNKDDGSRAIRYDGADEAYAVNELYLKLKERIAEQKAANNARRTVAAPTRRKKSTKDFLLGLLVDGGVITLIIVIAIIISIFTPNRGYYNYGGRQYYYLDHSWYIYNGSSWESTYVDDELSHNYSDYYESTYYDSDYATSDFEDTSYYSEWEASQDDDDWDSSSSWSSSDSWDSGGGDWSSDW